MRILLIEDDSATAQSVMLMLKAAGLDVDAASFGQQGIERGRSDDYDLILLDLMLPDMSGFQVLRALRGDHIRTPVLVLSSLDGVRDKAQALGFGADDYLTKPFHKDELIARIHAVARRCKKQAPATIKVGDLMVNIDHRTVELAGVPLHLTLKEYEILALLAARQGTILTKEMLLTHLYGGIDEPCLKIVDVFLCKLRKKIAAVSPGQNYIETIWGRGYVLQDPARQRRMSIAEPADSARAGLRSA
jgi:two-component system, cell cycle response regulator CtrA